MPPASPALSRRRRGPGRPRQVAGAARMDTRAEILTSAARLFSRQSVAGTTMAQIAEATGVRTPALYYHFADKEAVLGALADACYDAALAVVRAVADQDAPVPVRLYRLIRDEAVQLCSGPYELGFLFDPALRDPAFRSSADKLQTWRRTLLALIEAGIADGDFRPVDPWIMDVAISGILETTAKRWRQAGERTPEQVGIEIADLMLSSLLRAPDRLAALRAEAAESPPAPAAVAAG